MVRSFAGKKHKYEKYIWPPRCPWPPGCLLGLPIGQEDMPSCCTGRHSSCPYGHQMGSSKNQLFGVSWRAHMTLYKRIYSHIRNVGKDHPSVPLLLSCHYAGNINARGRGFDESCKITVASLFPSVPLPFLNGLRRVRWTGPRP